MCIRDRYIYAASDNSIFIYNTQTSELTKITTKEGLAGEAISSIYFSSNHNKLIAGFVNGLIQVIDFNTSNIFSIYDIIDKTTISPNNKRINNFNEFDQHTYISTNYGISVFNLDSLEFGDTFFIGTSGAQISVAETTVLGEYIYAAVDDLSDQDTHEPYNGSSFNIQKIKILPEGQYPVNDF